MEEKNNNKKSKGRPSYKPTDAQRLLVKELAGFGITQDMIATKLGITDDTLRKYFEHELALGKAEASAMMAQAIFKKALSGSEKLMMYWGNCHLGWSEKSKIEITGKDGGAVQFDINVSSSEAIDRLLAGMRKDED